MQRLHGDARLGRRQFLQRLLGAGAGTVAGLSLFDLMRGSQGAAWSAPAPPPLPGTPPDKQTQNGITIPVNDPAISAGSVEYQGLITPLSGYLSSPSGTDVYPGVLVIHDVFGLTEHVKDVTRRLAKAGYVALAPDLLSRLGGTDKQGDVAKIATALASRGMLTYLQDLNSAVSYLESRPLAAKSRIGTLGFGLGGNLAWALLAANPDLKAGVTLYGGIPPTASLRSIKSAVLAIFAEQDQQDASDVTDLDQAMKKTGLPWAFKTEPKANRGFFDDSRDRYVGDAAKDAWKMALDWYGKHLGA